MGFSGEISGFQLHLDGALHTRFAGSLSVFGFAGEVDGLAVRELCRVDLAAHPLLSDHNSRTVLALRRLGDVDGRVLAQFDL